MEELKNINPAFEVTDEAVENMGCIFAYELRAQGIEKLYTEEQLEQAEQIGMQRIWDLLPESYQKELRSTRDEVIKEHLKFVEPQDSLDEVMEKINSLISEYDFPLSILQDVHQRLNDCTEVGYAKQQLRYLQNIKKSMEVQDEEV